MATRIETRNVGHQSYEVIIAEIDGAFAEIWPALGGNCVRWIHPQAGEMLFAPPIDEFIARSTRGGIPILFPFPNRIRDGRFTWLNRTYQLPKNDSSGANAIHGFTPRTTFEVHSHGQDDRGSYIWLRNRGTTCVPNIASLWPAGWQLDLTWILQKDATEVHVEVKNTDDRSLPFGFGLHPYFRLTSPNDAVVVPAAAKWELIDGLPTGRVIDVEIAQDLQTPRQVSTLSLDDLYTNVESNVAAETGLRLIGRLARSDQHIIEVKATPEFREVVVFTPPHRQAICIEPYTCPTDAINLRLIHEDTGWQILDPAQTWKARVAFEISKRA